MKPSCRSLICFIMMSWSIPSLAGGWYKNMNIQYLYAGEVGNRYAIKVVGEQPNPDSCSVSFDLVIEPHNTKRKEMWAMLLSAYMVNKPVNIYLSGCSAGENKLPVISDLSFGLMGGFN